MKLSILHLSDVHIRDASDSILNRASEISSVCFEAARESEVFLIVVTGDITYSGNEVEYTLAERFLRSIRNAIAKEGVKTIHMIVSPGNHDCVLVPENLARSTIIDNIVGKPELAADQNIIDLCTQSQSAFFTFRSRLGNTPLVSDPLWEEFEYLIEGKVIRISAINAAWMSRLPEKQGELVFPIDLFESTLTEPCALRFVLIHHPLNWYAQSTYHPLRQALRSHASVVLSGHEHSRSSGEITEALVGENTFFEAPALQPDTSDDPAGFTLISVDIETCALKEFRFAISSNAITQQGDPIPHDICATPDPAGHELTDEWLSQLRDPGGNFKHPDKGVLEIDDFFVYPELKCLSTIERESANVSADVVLGGNHESSRILFVGEDKAGKSQLLLRAFHDFHRRGLVPVLVKAMDFRGTSGEEIEKTIKQKAGNIYKNVDVFNRAEKSKRIILIDDVDRIRRGGRALHRLLAYLETHFSCVVLTANSGFELTELLDKDATHLLNTYQQYEILRFGYKLRRKLIKRWCQCGSVTTLAHLDQKVHAVEDVLNSVVGRNLVPPRPIFVMVLLQSCEQGQQAEIQNSGFAHYYQYLITKSLQDIGVKVEHLNELYNYLSQLAWLYRSTGQHEIPLAQIRLFNKTFSEQFVTVELVERLEILCKARILSKRGECYSFTYPYIYYFFVGKYLADNLHQQEIKTIVTKWCGALHVRENAHSILFLTHHRNDPWVLEQMADALRSAFSSSLPMKFDGDVGALNGLIDSASQLVFSAPDVDKNQEKQRQLRDEVEEIEDEREKQREEVREGFEFVDRLYLVVRTAENIGQVLKNYYGSLERSVKMDLMKEIFDGLLRLLRAVLDELITDPDMMVKDLESMLKAARPKLAEDKRKEAARNLCFRIIGLISFGVIVKAAQVVNTEKLEDDVREVVRKNSTNAYRLIGAATQLMHPGVLPIDEIKKLSKEFESNAFAFTILQSLGAYHLHLYFMEFDDRQKLCESLKISLTRSREIEFKVRNTKLLKGR